MSIVILLDEDGLVAVSLTWNCFFQVSQNKTTDTNEQMNRLVFGISITERQKKYEDIDTSNEDYIDVPAFFRKGIITLKVQGKDG